MNATRARWRVDSDSSASGKMLEVETDGEGVIGNTEGGETMTGNATGDSDSDDDDACEVALLVSVDAVEDDEEGIETP